MFLVLVLQTFRDFPLKLSRHRSLVSDTLLLQLIEAAYANPEQAKFMNKEKIEQYRGMGGVSTHYYNYY